jgi:hypothetical protein
MWIVFAVVIIIALVVIGSVLMGGVFTIVTVPIVALAALVGLGWRFIGGLLQERVAESEGGRARPSSSETLEKPARREPSTPEELVDARRAAQ